MSKVDFSYPDWDVATMTEIGKVKSIEKMVTRSSIKNLKEVRDHMARNIIFIDEQIAYLVDKLKEMK